MGGNGTKLLDITGQVLEADVKERQFQLWTDESNHVSVSFRESEEADVTTALKDHKSVRVRVKGWGETAPNGKLLRITQVEELSLQPASAGPIDRAARPIEEIIAELAAEVPQAEWDRLPRDLTDHLDHYLYGTPQIAGFISRRVKALRATRGQRIQPYGLRLDECHAIGVDNRSPDD